jgi:hypothetical protein
MNRSGADAKRFSRCEDSCPGTQLLTDALDNFGAYWATPETFSLILRPRKASLDPFDYNAALELGKDAKHLKHRLPGWRAGIEALLMQIQINVFRM